MIVREQPSALRLFFVVQGSVVPRIIGKLLFISVIAVVVLLVDQFLMPLPHISFAVMSVFGVALSLILGFRNNAAYERWWDARKLWGDIIGEARQLGRIATIFVMRSQDRADLLNLIVAFTHLHRGFLRGVDAAPQITSWIGEETAQSMLTTQNPADAALRAVSGKVGDLHREGQIDGFGQVAFAKALAILGHAQAGCERIVTTPLPLAYSLLVRRTTYIYCLLLPFALIENTGWLSPFFTLVVAYVFFGLQAVTNELEHPFGDVKNGLPLDAMCRTVEISVAEATQKTPPPPLMPRNHLLT
ncbi:putative membrane protein [Monaibacterium marinum]|uniref:Putative membrane protein n=1 Tax=Pontivivens marinum TaxID=1690039 RepID=A0A2C9CMN4_9RHOB|nr:bestrophin family ion channel [Monaibacterium marinum]SOH92791.1 putative membrane protein [Monaibacterium marinum]